MSCTETCKSTSHVIPRRWSVWIALIGLALGGVPAFGQHIHELYYNNAFWADTDLTSLTGGPVVYQQPITAFYTVPNDQLHVYYVSNNNLDFHVHQLYFDGSSWSDADLTVATGGMAAANSSGMSGFSIGNAQYVYFCASDFSVHEYSYGANGNWNWVDTALPSPGLGCNIEGLVAFATHPNNQRHVYYQAPAFQGYGPPNNIRQLYFNGATWSNENLTAETKGVRALVSPMSGFSIGNAQYLFFQSTNGHIHEYSYTSANGWSWKDLDLTTKAGGTPAGTFESIGTTAFVVPGTTKMEVYYAAATNQDVHQMTFKNNAWRDTDLSALTSSSGPVSLTQMVGFATTPNNQLHLYFDSFGDSLINQLYYNGSNWSDEVLPSVQVGGFGGSAGFALGNLQHLYYISGN